MIRTWKVMQFCAQTSVRVPFYRQFGVVSCVQQKLASSLCAPRGSRVSEIVPEASSTTPGDPAGKKQSAVPSEHTDDGWGAEDELLNNRKSIPNLKVSELLKDVPRSKRMRPERKSADASREAAKPPAPPVHRKTAIEKDTLQILQHRYQDPNESEERYDKELKVRYTILQSNDARYRDLMMLIGSRKNRERERMLVLEGRRLIMDGYQAGLRLEAIVTSDVKLLADLTFRAKLKACPIFLVKRQTMMEWSSLTTSPGLIGIFGEPSNMSELVTRNGTGSKRLPVTVVCDNIREPNNLGSIVRSCAAVSVREVILLKGCAHPWDLKCLRGGTGAHFRVPIYGPIEAYQLPEHVRAGSIFVVADNKKPTDERNGFRWKHYDRIDYGSADHVVLVIGGETYGVSDDIRSLILQLTQNDGEQAPQDRKFVAHIPLANGVESLNTASALSVILYEMRRTLLQLEDTT
uniref:tRNA/rRNA methyltransferase SpoU type domain-containing protein n=1 Tax=Anopheles melas TaxID=34690 RepID=A0A182TFC3_9DIPT